MHLVNMTKNVLDLTSRVAYVHGRRALLAERNFCSQLEKSTETMKPRPAATSQGLWDAWASYTTDWLQRWVLFWDTIRQRGNNFLEHDRAGKPPVLAFEYEIIVDGREFDRPVNYALARIVPPAGVTVDEKKRPFIIIDPRAGHGPGIGGFKKDSEIGVALRAGHPVYSVIFFARPEPGQTLPDVSEAEAGFVAAVADRHPHSPKPAIVGNCQCGWATMLLAASRPDITGPVVINGAPMSYWSGNWQGGDAENPMRYVGGLVGGAWPVRLMSDLGNGLFDGANIVANFENLNPANTLWTKYYHLFDKADTEPPRFLGFEKWWGGYFLMNEAEMCWIVDNLFVGNRLARGEVEARPNSFFDLKAVRSPVVVFSSSGDNITPPQQALNWIADVYSSTEEIKANGQVIVGLFHEDVGHLGIFVSGKVAKKEHTQIVEVLEFIEQLRPGLYLMRIDERRGRDGKPTYDVWFEERRLENLRKLNRLERRDEKPFELVSAISEFNDVCYTLFVRPLVRPFVNEAVAEVGRAFHPLRWQRWAFSDLNPWLWPVAALAPLIKAARRPAADDNPFRRAETAVSQAIVAELDLYRDLRDAATEALFFQTYGGLVALGTAGSPPALAAPAADPRELPEVKTALAGIGTGGYAEAVALIGALLGKGAGTVPLARLELADKLIVADEFLSQLTPEAIRRLRADQSVVAELEPERGLQSLPRLLAAPADRRRALHLLDEVLSTVEPTREQQKTLERIGEVLGGASRRRSAGSALAATAT
jgi:hypothetical protein